MFSKTIHMSVECKNSLLLVLVFLTDQYRRTRGLNYFNATFQDV